MLGRFHKGTCWDHGKFKKKVMWAFLFQWDAQCFEHTRNKEEKQKCCNPQPPPPPTEKNLHECGAFSLATGNFYFKHCLSSFLAWVIERAQIVN